MSVRLDYVNNNEIHVYSHNRFTGMVQQLGSGDSYMVMNRYGMPMVVENNKERAIHRLVQH